MKALKTTLLLALAAIGCLTLTQSSEEAQAGIINSCKVKVKVTNGCPHVVKLIYVTFAHTKGAKNHYTIPTLGFVDLKSGKSKSWRYSVLRSCSTKKRIKVQYRHPKRGNSTADWITRTISSSKQKGKKISFKLNKCW